MNKLKLYEDFESGERDSRNYNVTFHDDSENHLVMMKEETRDIYGDSFRSGEAANREIRKYMEMGYSVTYYGPDLDYAQEIVD